MNIYQFIKNKFNEKEKRIYVIDIFGEISYSNKFHENNCNANTVLQQLYEIYDKRNDYQIGILLHINSPGGTCGASEEIANMIAELRIDNIPIISSIGDICTSGAYLIASHSNYIFANKMSLIGSIGVLMPCLNATSLSEKLGIKIDYLKAGEKKDLGNAFRNMTPEEKEYIENMLKYTHKEFINAVKFYRQINNSEELTDGRFFNSSIALKNNFIDQYGGYFEALNYLLEKMNTTKDQVKIIKSKNKTSFIKNILSFLSPVSFSLNQSFKGLY